MYREPFNTDKLMYNGLTGDKACIPMVSSTIPLELMLDDFFAL